MPTRSSTVTRTITSADTANMNHHSQAIRLAWGPCGSSAEGEPVLHAPSRNASREANTTGDAELAPLLRSRTATAELLRSASPGRRSVVTGFYPPSAQVKKVSRPLDPRESFAPASPRDRFAFRYPRRTHGHGAADTNGLDPRAGRSEDGGPSPARRRRRLRRGHRVRRGAVRGVRSIHPGPRPDRVHRRRGGSV